jgi:putative Mn2+ efflux pump MntP
MSDPLQPRSRSRARGCGFGCGGFFFVLIVGIALSLFNLAIGVGLSFRVPFTASNFTVAGSIGEKAKVAQALPGYTRGRLAGNQNFINQTQTLTIGPAEGAAVVILGKQDGAPPIDLHLVAQ